MQSNLIAKLYIYTRMQLYTYTFVFAGTYAFVHTYTCIGFTFHSIGIIIHSNTLVLNVNLFVHYTYIMASQIMLWLNSLIILAKFMNLKPLITFYSYILSLVDES